MNREIKFRWWTGEKIVDNVIVNGFVNHVLKGKNVQQFTGFKDRHGKEIYEGDIVREAIIDHSTEEGWFWSYSIVEFEMGCWVLKEIGHDYSKYDSLLDHIHLYDSTEEIEVCGNIFENQEMLSSNP